MSDKRTRRSCRASWFFRNKGAGSSDDGDANDGRGVLFVSSPQGMMMAAGSLMGHLIYGATVGLVYGHQPVDQPIGDVSTLGL